VAAGVHTVPDRARRASPDTVTALLDPATASQPGQLLDLMTRVSGNREYMMTCEVRSFIGYWARPGPDHRQPGPDRPRLRGQHPRPGRHPDEQGDRRTDRRMRTAPRRPHRPNGQSRPVLGAPMRPALPALTGTPLAAWGVSRPRWPARRQEAPCPRGNEAAPAREQLRNHLSADSQTGHQPASSPGRTASPYDHGVSAAFAGSLDAAASLTAGLAFRVSASWILGIRTLALLTRSRGAEWGANDPGHRAIPGHVQPFSRLSAAREFGGTAAWAC
jgi:hypothetical protein